MKWHTGCGTLHCSMEMGMPKKKAIHAAQLIRLHVNVNAVYLKLFYMYSVPFYYTT
jgi:hypothetical protein